MFRITQLGFRPGGVDEVRLVVAVAGRVLTVNADEFDLSFMEPGSELPRAAMGSDHFRSDVVCDETGLIHLTIAVPYGPTPSEAEIYPPVLESVGDGIAIDVTVPALTLPEVELPDKTAKVSTDGSIEEVQDGAH